MSAKVEQSYLAQGGGATLTQASVVVGSGQGLVVLLHTSNASGTTQTISGVTWNGAAMTQHGASVVTGVDTNGNAHRHAAFYLPTPTPGTASVVATLGGSALQNALAVFVVSGHDTAAMIDDWIATVVGSAGTPQPTVTVAGSTASGLVLDLVRARESPAMVVGASQALRQSATGSGATNWYFYTSSEAATGANTVMSWTGATQTHWNTQAIAVKAAVQDRTTQPADGVGVNPIYSGVKFLWNAVAPTKDQNSANTSSSAGSSQSGPDGTFQQLASAERLVFALTKPTTAYTLVLGVCFPVASSTLNAAVEIPGGNFRVQLGTTGGGVQMQAIHTAVASATSYTGAVGGFDSQLWTYVVRWDGTTLNRYVKRGDNDATETTVSNTMGMNNAGSAQISFGGNGSANALGYYSMMILDNDVGEAEALAIRDNIWRIFAPEAGGGGGVDAVSATGTTASSTATPAKTGTGSTRAGGAMSSTPVIPVPTFTTEPLTNNSGTVRASEAVDWTWYPLGVIGAMAGISALDGSGTTAADGTLTVTGMSAGAGILWITTADGGVFYESGAAAL